MTGRIEHHPILGSLENRKQILFHFDGKTYTACESETIAAALLANGVRTLRVHEEKGTPRGIYCNIGHCFECRVTVNGVKGIRACLTLVEEGMNVESGVQLPVPFKEGGHQK
ncbi:(2Fe-2S)-binding protein [Brevibacillus panacihumi]|uniref:(2Fe-2S)-binding protein n=1 Tax=Brevibacillus panacihumi TaxID=497735 RepID=A0A3M8BY54_9BACL|nr:(2Fe-2S)-binding protein [Brevibacillus panacihumi]RNB68027.1 (2Fe-2S)-binding protein [Brevibacillus panacihumi]